MELTFRIGFVGVMSLVLCIQKGSGWSLQMVFNDGSNAGTRHKIYGNIIGSWGNCGEMLLNTANIPDNGYVLNKTLTCPSAVGRVKEFTIRSSGTDGAGLIKLVLSNSEGVVYTLLDQTSTVGLDNTKGMKGVVKFPVLGLDFGILFEELTDGKLGALVETSRSAADLITCVRRCLKMESCQACSFAGTLCELRKRNDNNGLGTKTYFRLKSYKRLEVKPYQ